MVREQVYARGGLLLNGIVAGDNMLIRKMLIRSSNLPMLAAVVQSWKGKNRKGAPLHLDRLRIQGMQVHNLRGSSLKYLHQMFAEFPSTLSIHHLELVHTELVRNPLSDEGPLGGSSGEVRAHRSACL